jgi:hypothetical protein
LFCNSVSGCDSTLISEEMMLLTSSPLPMPAELIEPLVEMEVMRILARSTSTQGLYPPYRPQPARVELPGGRKRPAFPATGQGCP